MKRWRRSKGRRHQKPGLVNRQLGGLIIASGDLHNLGPGVPGCHGRMDQEGPCSGLRQSAIVINKVCIQSVIIRAPHVVCGKLLQAVVDTGIEVLVLSEAFYCGLPDEVRPPLIEASLRLVVADKSSQLKDLDIACADIMIADLLNFQWPVYVASISDSLLLGWGIIDAKDLLISPRHGLHVQNQWIPCGVKREPCHVGPAQVELVEDVTIPAHHEIITTGKPLQSTAGAEVCAAFEPRQQGGAGFLMAR